MINVDKVKEDLSLSLFGAKGWYSNKNIECPYCNRGGKFGFIFNANSGVIHCFFCGESKPIQRYLRDIDRTDLLSYEKDYSCVSRFKRLKKEKEEIVELEEVKLPRGLKNIENDDYLENRGFTDYHYKQFQPSYTNHILESKLKGYMVFKLFQEGKLVSWLARTKHSYNWHKENLRQHKEEGKELVLRYRNSTGSDFDSILGGYDEITDNTHTVILVEGLFDKINTDKLLGLDRTDEVKCCFTFGNSVSNGQIKLLRKKKSVDTTILFYDPDAIKQMKDYSLVLNQYYNTFVAEIKWEGVDPGDITNKQINEVFSNLYSPIEYYTNKINKKINGKK